MKPVKAILKTSFTYRRKKEDRLMAGTEVLILGKWENSGSRTRLTYLIFLPEKKMFMRLDSGHLKVENKEQVKLELPKFSLNETGREKEIDGSIKVAFSSGYVIPEGACKPTFGKYRERDVVVVGVIENDEYPSGAGYILYPLRKKIGDSETEMIVDSLEVEIEEQGNMIKL